MRIQREYSKRAVYNKGYSWVLSPVTGQSFNNIEEFGNILSMKVFLLSSYSGSQMPPGSFRMFVGYEEDQAHDQCGNFCCLTFGKLVKDCVQTSSNDLLNGTAIKS
jgi:hypothetical protein